MQPSTPEIRLQIYTAVCNALISKYPTNNSVDHKYIADTASKLTDILINKFNGVEIPKELLTED
jgi:hypothetical protein